jgi:hypothetical protein
MGQEFFSGIVFRKITGAIAVILLSATAFAQQVSIAGLSGRPMNFPPVASAPSVAPVVATSTLPEAPSHHRFWDNENRALFVTVAAFSTADFAATRANLQNGGRELNPVTRIFSGSTAGLAVNFVGETAGVIGLSYYFHKTGHHKLERLTPMFNIGVSAFAVAYDRIHR